jgi:hypothetical protein
MKPINTTEIAEEIVDILAEHKVPIRLLDDVIEEVKVAAQGCAIIQKD